MDDDVPAVSLSEQNHQLIRARKWEVAVLPFGATEPHNYHMPYGTDCYQVDAIGRSACEYATARGAAVLLLPTVPFGVNTNHLKIPGAVALSLNPSTLFKIIEDLTDSLSRQGIKKMVLLNGHGANELKPLIRELHHRTNVFHCVCDWFRMATDTYKEIFTAPGEHADEVETSLGLSLFPHLMKMEQAGPGRGKPTRFEAINRGWISITRPWHLLTEDTGMGNPYAATAEKGKRLVQVLTERLGTFLVELANSPLDESFPY